MSAVSEPADGPDTTAPIELDERGRLCPLPVIALARAAADLPAGGVVRLLADDPAAAVDVPAWCRMRGHTLLGADQGTYLVRIEPPRTEVDA